MHSNSVKKLSRRESLFWKMVVLALIALVAFLLATIQGWMAPIS